MLLRIVLVLLIFSSSAIPDVFAQTRDLLEQTTRDTTKLVPRVYEFEPPLDLIEKETETTEEKPKNDFRNFHGSYYVSLMGPRLEGDSNTTYNVYLDDIAPIQLFHVMQLGYQVNPDLLIGVSDSAVQALSNNVVGKNGNLYHSSFDLYDPKIYFNLPHLLEVPGWNVFTYFSFSLSVTEASQEIGKITALEFSQNWTINNFPSPWTIGFTTYAQPQFYTEPIPPGYTDRQTFSGSVGHILSYRVSPTFALQSSTKFDIEHRSPDPQGPMHFGSGLPDRAQFSCSITPETSPLFLSIGGYFQFLVFDASLDTSIFGADFSIGF